MQNLHPLFVHFPIALLMTAALTTFLAAFNHKAGAEAFARVCLYLGTLAMALTAVTGFFAAQTVARVAGAGPLVEQHRNFAVAAFLIAVVLSAWSIVAWRRLKRAPRPLGIYLLGHAALLVTLALAGWRGGLLVHDYGVGTKLTGPGGPLYDANANAGPGGTSAGTDSVPTSRDFR